MTKKPILTWDTCELIESYRQDQFEQWKDNKEAWPEYEGMTDGEFLEMLYKYQDIDFEPEWEYMLEAMTELMLEIGKGYWNIKASRLGWRSLSGEKYIEARTGKELLEQILPETDCTFKVYKYSDYLRIVNYHHDAPTGEIYIIRACAEVTYFNNK